MNRGAVFHANHTESGILDLVGLRIPGAESVAFCGLGKVPQFVKYGTIHADRLVIAHHPQRHVQRMRADINERPAALQRFVGEYPPGGNRAAAHGMRLGIIDIPQLTVFTCCVKCLDFGTETVLIADSELFAAFFPRL